jgi:hypothetical protein
MQRNANLNCNSLLQSNNPSFNPIAAKMQKKKGPENYMTPDGQRHNIIRPVVRRAYKKAAKNKSDSPQQQIARRTIIFFRKKNRITRGKSAGNYGNCKNGVGSFKDLLQNH